jgi:hypothetical protein
VFDADPLTVRFPRRIAVVNRGEAAVRLIRAVRELNAEYGCGIATIALHTDAERRAMFVRQADEAVTLRRTSGIVHLDHAELERALRESKADAVWVGWGFVAEDIAFAELCARLNLTFIGPPAAAMRTLGDKVEAKLLAEKVGVPLAPWSRGPVETREKARRHAEAIGYPLIIKARSGGFHQRARQIVRHGGEVDDEFWSLAYEPVVCCDGAASGVDRSGDLAGGLVLCQLRPNCAALQTVTLHDNAVYLMGTPEFRTTFSSSIAAHRHRGPSSVGFNLRAGRRGRAGA